MPLTEVKSPQLVRPGPIGLGIRVLLGALVSPRGVRPHLPTAVGALAGRRVRGWGRVIGLAGSLMGDGVWNPAGGVDLRR